MFYWAPLVAIVLSFYRFGSTQLQIWLDDVRCSGTESRLTSCSRNSYGSHNCDHSKDVAIYCSFRSNTGSGTSGTISCSNNLFVFCLYLMWQIKHQEIDIAFET